MIAVTLTDAELMALDGHCRPEIQAKVDAAKSRLDFAEDYPDLTVAQAGFVADVVNEAITSGRLVWHRAKMRHCNPGAHRPDPPYVLYKSGPRRGQPNYDRRRYLHGRELAQRFINIEGAPLVSACDDCLTPLLPVLVDALARVRVQLPPELSSPGRPDWRRRALRKCTKCTWEGHEGQMTAERTVIGDGWYPAYCPNCGAGGAFSRDVEHVDGFEVVDESKGAP